MVFVDGHPYLGFEGVVHGIQLVGQVCGGQSTRGVVNVDVHDGIRRPLRIRRIAAFLRHRKPGEWETEERLILINRTFADQDLAVIVRAYLYGQSADDDRKDTWRGRGR